MELDSFLTNWSNLHGGAQIKGFVRGWLNISFWIVKPLAKLRVNPNFLTFLGLFFAILVWRFPTSWAAFAFLLISLIFDGIDGSLAIIRGITSKKGAVIDSVVDRLSEVFWALALYELGANGLIIFITLLAAYIQEYLRARAAGLGHQTIGIVTIGERPVRAILISLALIGWQLNSNCVTVITCIWLLVQVIALGQITRAFSKDLAS